MTHTSMSAAEAIAGHKNYIQRQVLMYLQDCPKGSTHQEAEEHFAATYNPSTIRIRFRELANQGLVYDTGLTRPSRSGCQQIAWASIFNPIKEEA